ncbi:hypothetical protein L7F22_053365 [Adiantum nelumboides]|nr:hypothetical protein [Adiantum nelumboides]
MWSKKSKERIRKLESIANEVLEEPKLVEPNAGPPEELQRSLSSSEGQGLDDTSDGEGNEQPIAEASLFYSPVPLRYSVSNFCNDPINKVWNGVKALSNHNTLSCSSLDRFGVWKSVSGEEFSKTFLPDNKQEEISPITKAEDIVKALGAFDQLNEKEDAAYEWT